MHLLLSISLNGLQENPHLLDNPIEDNNVAGSTPAHRAGARSACLRRWRGAWLLLLLLVVVLLLHQKLQAPLLHSQALPRRRLVPLLTPAGRRTARKKLCGSTSKLTVGIHRRADGHRGTESRR